MLGGSPPLKHPLMIDVRPVKTSYCCVGPKLLDERQYQFQWDGMPADLDFSKGVRRLHHIPSDAKVFLPASIERSVWQYFSLRAQKKGVDLSELLTDVLKRDIEINEALK